MSASPDALRVLHCPTSVGGQAPSLARVERKHGLRSICVVFAATHFAYGQDEVIWRENWGALRQQLARWGLLLRAWRRFDVVHYNFGSPILPWTVSERLQRASVIVRIGMGAYAAICRWMEQGLLRRKVIAVTYQGDDARQGDYSLDNFKISIARESIPGYYTAQSDRIKREMIRYFDRYADLIYAVNPDLLHVLPTRARFVPYAHVDPRDWLPPAGGGGRASAPPVVVHAPSHQGVKGTKYILAAVARLKAEGVECDFRLVEKLSNRDARLVYEQADLVIDQLLAGWYGGFAVEAMALGKPVICYVRENDLQFIPPEMRRDIPLVQADPESIYAVLRQCLTSGRSGLAQIGAASRRYVQAWHDPEAIVSGLKADYIRASESRAAHT